MRPRARARGVCGRPGRGRGARGAAGAVGAGGAPSSGAGRGVGLAAGRRGGRAAAAPAARRRVAPRRGKATGAPDAGPGGCWRARRLAWGDAVGGAERPFRRRLARAPTRAQNGQTVQWGWHTPPEAIGYGTVWCGSALLDTSGGPGGGRTGAGAKRRRHAHGHPRGREQCGRGRHDRGHGVPVRRADRKHDRKLARGDKGNVGHYQGMWSVCGVSFSAGTSTSFCTREAPCASGPIVANNSRGGLYN